MDYVIKQTETFAKWLISMRDLRAQVAIARRIDRACAGNFGDVKSVGEGVSEMRIDMGAGYRVYFTVRQRKVVFLLVGGDKSTQSSDIRTAIALAKEI
jgi:putative addiction module killer protein